MGTRLLERASLKEVAETATTDADVLLAVRQHDRAAFEELYRRYSGRLFSLGLKLLGDAGLAEELVQETFVRLWRTTATFDPAKGSASAFIFVIARRLAVDLWRRPSSRARPPLAPADGDADGLGRSTAARAGAGAVDDPVDAFVLSVVVRDALDSLSPSHREVLELAYRSDLTQRQIARRLEVPLGTVKTRAYYALRALKLALEERGIDA
jgi:RNA polymerase sigma-70 factor (ECF subfamily)